MASNIRKLLLLPQIITQASDSLPCSLACNNQTNPYGICLGSCFQACPDVCKQLVSLFNDPLIIPSSPPPPPPPAQSVSSLVPILRGNSKDELFRNSFIRIALIVFGCVIVVVSLLGILVQGLRFYRSWQHNNNLRRRRSSSSRRRDSSVLFSNQEGFLDENQGPQIDHPIWYINTVGLEQAVIDSIPVCRYRKDEGLIEGTDCSVCLSEFEEDESLRLLPKCSHAFHIICIDTWLRSHKNCPMCRAPIVSATEIQLPESNSNSNDLDSSEESQVNNIGEGETSEVRTVDDNRAETDVECLPIKPSDYPSRVQSDLAENRHALVVQQGEIQPIRRSVSLDSVSAMAIYSVVANIVPDKNEGSSTSQLSTIKYLKSKISTKRRSGSLSIIKLMNTPILMKRSSSSSGKSSLSSKANSSQQSILPL